MAFTDSEMAVLAQLAYADVNTPVGSTYTLESLLEGKESWLRRELGAGYSSVIDGLKDKVKGQDYTIAGTINDNKKTGLVAFAIKDPNNELTVCCRGTEPNAGMQDIITDAQIGLLYQTNQQEKLREWVRDMQQGGYSGYYFTGHSLGGNLAMDAAITLNEPGKVKGVVTFNAPGFNDQYYAKYGPFIERVKGKFISYKNEYDYVSSIYDSPGKSVIIKSGKSGNHLLFDDHSICNFQMNDGKLVPNQSQKKKHQTQAVYGLSQLLNYQWSRRVLGYSQYYTTRDFSERSRQELLSLVAQVENEKWCDFTDWVGDRWLDFEEYIGTLDVKKYVRDLNSYHKKVIDKNNTTKEKINEIFTNVKNLDTTYSGIILNVEEVVKSYINYIKEMSAIINPTGNRFNATGMSSLDNLLEGIDKERADQVRDLFVQVVDGKYIYNENLLYEYMKKEPTEMTEVEKMVFIEVIGNLTDQVAEYGALDSYEVDGHKVEIGTYAVWADKDKVYADSSAATVQYGDTYVKIMNAMMECSEDENSFAASLLKCAVGSTTVTVLGMEAKQNLKDIFGSDSFKQYVAKIETENSEQYFLKREVIDKLSSKSSGKPGKMDKMEDGINDKLKDKGWLKEDKEPSRYYDEDGNEISGEDAPTFYKKEATIFEVNKNVSDSVDIYSGEFKVGDNGKVSVKVGEAEVHAGVSGGFYVVGADGEKKFSPGVKAEVGTSVTAFEAEWEQQWFGDENLGVHSDVTVTAGQASANASLGAQFLGEDGKIDVQFGASAKAEAIAGEIEGEIGLDILGGGVGVKGGVNFGIGAHADVGYRDGVFKCDVGASLGLGVSLDLEVDVGGMVNTVTSGAKAAWNKLTSWW